VRERKQKRAREKEKKKGARVCGDKCVRDIYTTKITEMSGFMSFRSPVCGRKKEKQKKRAQEKGKKKGERVCGIYGEKYMSGMYM